MVLEMDIYKPKFSNQFSPKLSNGYILPEGRVTPNAIFVGGIDMKVDESEMRELFGRYGSVKEVKIITYRGGICKGYGFIYFHDDTNIQPIIEQQISFKGRKLKLGPAIMKERISRHVPHRLVGPGPWVNPIQYFYCSCCAPVGGGMVQPPAVVDGGSQVTNGLFAFSDTPYSYSSFGGVVIPQMPVSYAQNAYGYQYAPAHWTAEHRTQPVNQVTAFARNRELCGLWSPDHADCAVVCSH
ncbi:deleted in azoospermia-like isoform X2 [Takifugu rubripes]|uniref:deleted in azoospermia-like isoform X2 n=1 Tax=Takifugu rubripes TaxID=31033 RepID=UPI0005D1B701|nr:deleted in azoospermia-like isoform X2 [Takifugu rubripes]XP_056876846.1 deleted in azoospermia-like isoform X3 [Takifugu flavidus]|eukprot:XP_011607376.1 PREDICTED: deleted in azoospermia-like isoform X2 [Takifugu rubripes]